MSGEPKPLEPHSSEYHQRCRIPLRMAPGRQRPIPKPKPLNNDNVKNKVEVVSTHPLINSRCPTRPNTSEMSRPKSANRATEVVGEPAHSSAGSRYGHPERERASITQKKPQHCHRKTVNEKFNEMLLNNKAGKQVITVPLKQKKATYNNHNLSADLPDQDTIKRCEELELQQEDFSEAAHMYKSMNDFLMDFNEEDSVTSRSDQITQLQTSWQEKIVQFEDMKNELNHQQNGILELYASLRNTKQKLTSMGQKTELPSTDDLRIMNVANMTPNQLLQLCAENKTRKDVTDNQANKALMVDIKKLNEIPLKLVETCEQTLATRKDLIDWFENLKNQERGCTKSSLSKKINEFNTETDMLACTLEIVKKEFLKELSEVLRTSFNERVALQLRTEELICEVSELNSQNTDLKKQLYSAEKQKTLMNKKKIEELEKELKEEKIKRMTMRDRLSRTEGHVKIETDRANLLEAALNQARTQTRNLERTVQQQHDQNQQLEKDFAMELNKLKESLKQNTIHLEEIASAREILQQEKEDLKKKIEELSNHYNTSLASMKDELNKNIAKLIEVEQKYNDEVECKNKLNETVESQCARLLEYELRNKDMTKRLQETENTLSDLVKYKNEFEQIKCELDEATTSLDKHAALILEKDKEITELEKNLKQLNKQEFKFKTEINNKDDRIAALEKQLITLQEQSQENEHKMETYEEQLTTLKNHLSQLQEHFIEFENLNELHDLVNRQNAKLLEMTRKNDELSEEVYTKQNDLKHLTKLIAEHEDLIKQRQSILQMLSEKEEEQSNVLKLNNQISEKNAEIDSLITNIDTRKEQISQLEKIILAIEDQNRKGAIQKRKDEEKIHALERKIAEYEIYIANKNKELAAPENLDNLIKILEDELGTPFESQMITTNRDSSSDENVGKYNGVNEGDYYRLKEPNYESGTKTVPTKVVMGNFVKKTYISKNGEKYKNDNLYLSRKEALKHIDTEKWISENHIAFRDNNNVCVDATKQHPKEKLQRNLQYVVPNHVKDEKKCKMFKFASHRIP